MQILIFNWKDSKNPRAGGAEYATHEYARHLVKLGHTVTLFTTRHPSSKHTEIIDGIRIIRQGNRWNVYLCAFFYYQKNKNLCDLVIDQIHGIPFFTPLYVKKPHLAWIHEIAGQIWFYEFSNIVARLGNFFEKNYFYLYKNTPFLTDSQSTKKELIAYGIPKEHIIVIPLAVNKPAYNPKKMLLKKSKTPTLVYIGRLTPMKRIEYALETVGYVRTQIPNIQLVVAGVGNQQYTKLLTRYMHHWGIAGNVSFIGKISESEKWRLLQKSWLLMHPSIKEGFGLTVLEAAATGTPTVCFDVGGLRDIVKNQINGIIISNETPRAMAEKIISILNNKSQLQTIWKKTHRWSSDQPSWAQQTQLLNKYLLNISQLSQKLS